MIGGLERVSFDTLPLWHGDIGHREAFEAFARSATRFLSGSVRTGSLGLDPNSFREAAQAAQGAAPDDSRRFFETHFVPARVAPADRAADGFLTGYFEPVLPASRHRTQRFTAPLHRRPPDLVSVTDANRPEGFDPAMAFARRGPDGTLGEYFDRAAIARGALDGQGLEIAWLESAADAFFVHIQGSARLELTDGSRIRVSYAAKSGHRFTAIGRILVTEGELVLETADMTGIRRWLAENPSLERALLDRNRSYIFFDEVAVPDERLGPVAAAGVPVAAVASLAVDASIHTYGTPVFVHAPTLALGEAPAPFARLLVAQDTGSAIVGPARGDLFVGTGAEAGEIAGRIRHKADFYALLPRVLVGEAAP